MCKEMIWSRFTHVGDDLEQTYTCKEMYIEYIYTCKEMDMECYMCKEMDKEQSFQTVVQKFNDSIQKSVVPADWLHGYLDGYLNFEKIQHR